MKSRNTSWKHGFKRLASLAGLAGLTSLTSLTSCKKLNCDFSYSPTNPAAGSVVTFTNSSTGADDYSWNFGDNGTSTTSSPTHIYRKPGTYTIKLTIIRNKVEKRTKTQYITVTDTIPTIACDTDTVYSFTPVKFYAQVYNPWKYIVNYRWSLPEDAVVLAGKSLDSSAVVCYLTKEGQKEEVGLHVQIGDKPKRDTLYAFTTIHKSGLSVIYQDNEQAYEQFSYIVNKQQAYQVPTPTSLSANLDALKSEQDTIYQYGQRTYTKATVKELLGEDVHGFQADRLMNKLYAYNTTGLWVSNITGASKRKLITTPIYALKVDGVNNRLYWATGEGLFVHQLLKTSDNKDSFSPQIVTTEHTHISKISINTNLH